MKQQLKGTAAILVATSGNVKAQIDMAAADNYYLDLDIEASTPIRVSFIDEDRNVIYTVRDTDFEEENIRMWLDKGNYSIYFSDFEGGSIYVEMSFE